MCGDVCVRCLYYDQPIGKKIPSVFLVVCKHKNTNMFC